MAHLPRHRAAVGLHHRRGIAFQRVAEGVVGGQEEPRLAALLDHRAAGALGQRHRVIGVVHRVRRALFVGQARGAGTDVDVDALLLRSDLVHRQRGARVGAAQQHVQPLLVHPFARLGGGDVGLVLVVGGNDFDGLAQHLAAAVLDRHLDGFQAAGAVDVGVQARHVGDIADLDGVAGYLRGSAERNRTHGNSRHRGREPSFFHLFVS
ncbi:hypothetical protein D3C81_1461780 [compost metagenome]